MTMNLSLKKNSIDTTPNTESNICMVGPHLSCPDDINDFPVFPPGTNSLLSKYLTRDIWNQLKDKKDDQGFSFKQAIFSGCKNTDSGIGVYAGSHDSYKAFAPLFDKIIDHYHNYTKSTDADIHTQQAQQMPEADISREWNLPSFSEEDAAMIVSTRIRVGRNLEGYPLGPGVSKEQRYEIMSKVVDACRTFDEDLKGTFYSLERMTKTIQKKLIEDHFLFKEGDRFLEACNLNKDWPSGRGIFHNDDKTLLVWVNEEDQLRIISMEQGADLKSVYERLCEACEHLQKTLGFSHDEHLNYITSCPTNLGTALRASVHIKLPKLSQDKERFQAIADEYHVQIRGVHGEHVESGEPIFDISNRRRLGRSEMELVEDMYNGVKAMIEAEKSL